jgi:hypothetical protein
MSAVLVHTTRDSLFAACEGFRKPLVSPVLHAVRNPFTGKLVSMLTWDPKPDEPVVLSVEPEPPGAMLDIFGFERVGVDAALGLLLPERAAELIERRRRPVRIGPLEGPFVWEVPKELVERLATTPVHELGALGARFAELVRDERRASDPFADDVLALDVYAATLEAIAEHAREAVADRHEMFEWLSSRD